MQALFRILTRALPLLPRGLVRRVAWRYVAGETIEELMGVARAIHGAGLRSTVDVLGENTRERDEIESIVDEYLRLIDVLASENLSSQVSVKPTHVGLRVGEDVAAEMLERIVSRAEERGLSATLDMEDVSTTDATLRLFRHLRERHEQVGVAVQAYLPRSVDDVEQLLDLRPTVRVCKGIYREAPGVTMEGRLDVRESFLRLVRVLLEGGGYAAIATHDPWLVEKSLTLLGERGVGEDSHEFQMLLGVGEGLRGSIRAAGSPLRLYCPYGQDWRAYSIRRLQENPQVAWYVVRSLLSTRALRWRERF